MINFVPQKDALSGVKDGWKATHLETGAWPWVTSRQGKGGGREWRRLAHGSPDAAVSAQPGGGEEAWVTPQPFSAGA